MAKASDVGENERADRAVAAEFAESADHQSPVPLNLRRRVVVRAPLSINETMRAVIKRLGWVLNTTPLKGDCESCDILWLEESHYAESLRGYQDAKRLNIIPGVKECAEKRTLALHLNRMKTLFPEDFDFVPETFVLPIDSERLVEARLKKYKNKKTWIVKPSAACGGDGIYLTQDLSRVNATEKDVVIQEYISNPLLIEGLKFDFRLYVLVTGMPNMKVYVCREGLARFATAPYTPPTKNNIYNTYVHLTNYSLNKYSSTFDNTPDSTTGTKRSASSVMEYLAAKGVDVQRVWESIDTLVVKTLVSIQPSMSVLFDSVLKGQPQCFHIIGFDVMLDDKLQPWLIEINNHPSLQLPDPVDETLKVPMLTSAMLLVAHDIKKSMKRATPTEKKKKNSLGKPPLSHEEYEELVKGSWRAVFPDGGADVATEHLQIFNTQLKGVFSLCCAVRQKHELSLTRFRKLADVCGLIKRNGDTTGLTFAELDLLFQKRLQYTDSHRLSIGFSEFCDLMLNVIAPSVYPFEPTMLAALRRFIAERIPAGLE